ncbi:hypothetical protein PPACK8108_LOCUS2621 [Phakopsora pachyrhizi]|uniref:Uncharacterized protein n=1 Tax=Phakopsora pachyrhizi TaxID=170000 RepID=A0AAV0AJH0_PHAPC|nr:hypothetical protein PPACK8108_LOCUS2621 [Phakopsora pachyrhizi]
MSPWVTGVADGWFSGDEDEDEDENEDEDEDEDENEEWWWWWWSIEEPDNARGITISPADMSVLPSQANQSQIQMLTLSMKFSKNSQTEPERPTGTSTSTVTETETSSSSSYSQLSNRASRGAPSKISPVDISSNSNDANCVVFDVDPEPKSYLSSLQQRTQVPETAQSECSHQTPHLGGLFNRSKMYQDLRLKAQMSNTKTLNIARLKPLAISYNHTRPVSKSPDKRFVGEF